MPAVDQGGEDPDGLCTEGLDAVGHGVVAIFRSIGDFGDPEVPTVSPPDTAHGLLRSGPEPAPASPAHRGTALPRPVRAAGRTDGLGRRPVNTR
ncbi:hypothetical protein [Streptomyces sp. NBC_01340]|uniref:hypothetical protein n=1 Tax=Streptomyces sp. NBC_01340 TaxID=2903830 RepID=UPI003DA2DCC8